uniref:Fork-head domain-containing protein n=1 Tax=Meloidogyne enterolobii TaxID=390850 RepID=A0A6V7W8R9_MELEN|nr:unnamed protein product [Meloidogyne enterolobii]
MNNLFLDSLLKQQETLTKWEMNKIKSNGNFGPNKPPYSFNSLISTAINESENKMCTIDEIYNFIIKYFDYYKNHKQRSDWQNLIKNILYSDENINFVKVEKETFNLKTLIKKTKKLLCCSSEIIYNEATEENVYWKTKF